MKKTDLQKNMECLTQKCFNERNFIMKVIQKNKETVCHEHRQKAHLQTMHKNSCID